MKSCTYWSFKPFSITCTIFLPKRGAGFFINYYEENIKKQALYMSLFV
ncbi:hypothetical protein QY97_03665 [Bacillus thermotolerans]|nr:hypothetical protein QY97_03665 [Bacillus thermotolerans]